MSFLRQLTVDCHIITKHGPIVVIEVIDWSDWLLILHNLRRKFLLTSSLLNLCVMLAGSFLPLLIDLSISLSLSLWQYWGWCLLLSHTFDHG